MEILIDESDDVISKASWYKQFLMEPLEFLNEVARAFSNFVPSFNDEGEPNFLDISISKDLADSKKKL